MDAFYPDAVVIDPADEALGLLRVFAGGRALWADRPDFAWRRAAKAEVEFPQDVGRGQHGMP